MNNIFNRIMFIEEQIQNLIKDIQIDYEYCENNKEEILDSLRDGCVNVGCLYKLNKANFNEETETS